MPVPTDTAAAADERIPASASEGGPACRPAEETVGSGGEENGGASSPVGSISESCRSELETGSAGEKQAAKIFIGGLNWQTTPETLKEFFEAHFGDVAECNIMKDQVTKKSRGFGFITFKKAETVDKVLKAHDTEPIYIDDKQIDPKIAVPPKKVSNRVNCPQVHVKRIFVGGLSSDTTDKDMKDYFEEFGEVTEVQLMFDRNTNRHRGFGFVSFKDEEPADKVCSIQYHDIRGKRVEVKVAQTKEEMQSRGRNITNRPPATNYGYPVASFGPYYHGNYHYDMAMGYVPGPMMYPGLKMRGTASRRDFQGPTYYGGFMEQRAPPMHGYYATGPSYGSMPMPHMVRGAPHYIDHPQIIHNMEYVTDHFQGMSLNSRGGGGYTNGAHSPPYPQSYDGNGGGGGGGGFENSSSASSSGSGSYSPAHSGSPTVNGPPSVNGYTQVPAFTGSPPSSYAVSY